jgi:hypothetical protein
MFEIINSFSNIIIRNKKSKTYLFVFDIDDTILHYGHINYVWFNQQIVENKSKYNTIDEAIEQAVHEWFQNVSICEPLYTDENGFKNLLNKIEKNSHDYIFLTARNPKFSTITLHHFEKLGIPTNKDIHFTSGQNKGKMLKEILENSNYHYDKIIFVDDSEKNLKDVYNVLNNLYPIELYKFELVI